MSSGESWTPSAGRPGSGQQRGGDEEQPAHDERAATAAPAPATDHVERLPSGDGPAGASKRRRARWRDLSPSALWSQPAPPAEELGEDDYWSYLRGDGGRSPAGTDTDQRDDGVATRQPPPTATEAWTPTAARTWSPRVTTDGEASARPLPEPELEPEPLLERPERPERPEPPRERVREPEPAGDEGVDPVAGHPAVPDEPGRPAGRALAGFTRRERVLPGIGRPLALTIAVTLGWLAVVAYGVVRLDLLWGLVALGAGVGALALGLQGRSVVGLAPVLVGAAAWGMATGGEVPASPSDLGGDLRLVGLNALYAVPLLIAYGLTTWLDAVGSARDRVRAVLGARRWWGSADAPDAEPDIGALEAIPSARFFQLPAGAYPHLVTAGRRVALIRSTVWPPGEYTVTETGEVHRDGRVFAQGSAEFRAAAAEARRWSERLGPVASAVTGFLVVHPASDRPRDRIGLDAPQAGGVHLVAAAEFVAVTGDYLAAEPYRLDVPLTERLGEHLPIFGAQEPPAA